MRRRRSLGGGFSPRKLFADGTVGAWYDPSDYSTLFQDSAGTTPVTAVEQPVGLMLDKSQGLVLGSELATGTPTAYSANGTVSVVGGVVTCTCTTNGNYGLSFGTITSSGKRYAISFTVLTNTGTRIIYAWAGNAGDSMNAGSTTGAKFGYVANNAGGITAIAILGGVAGESFSVSNISVKELPGNHASQATAASRPVLRARYNLLTYSEQFDNAAWNKVKASITPNAVVAPDGTTTADLLTVTADGYAYATISGLTVANSTLSCYFKAGTTSVVTLDTSGSANALVTFDLVALTATLAGSSTNTSASITDVGNGWRRCIVTRGSTAGTQIYIGKSSALTGETFYLWGADLRTGSSAGTYQRIAAATDYATAGFLPYLAFDGSDDSFGTNSINFSATDKMSVCAGVTKLSDTTGIITELSADIGTNNGSFHLANVAGTPSQWQFISKGTIASGAVRDVGAFAPITNTLTGLGNISGDLATLRVNGAQVAQSTSDQGTGNFGNYPLYIGRRNNATVPFNGRIYQLVVCGKALSASELASTEAYVATKTGVTL